MLDAEFAAFILWGVMLQFLIFLETWSCTGTSLIAFRLLWTSFAFMLLPALALAHWGDPYPMSAVNAVLLSAHVAYTIYAGYFSTFDCLHTITTAHHQIVTTTFTSVVGVVIACIDFIDRLDAHSKVELDDHLDSKVELLHRDSLDDVM